VIQEIHLDAGNTDALFWKGYCTAWDEFIELQCTPKSIWVGSAVATAQAYDRTAVVVFQDGVLAGGVILVPDNDTHVGKCLSVHFQYVLPEYRNLGISYKLMRQAMRIAKREEYPVLAYSHRIRDWEYKTIYRRVP